jgi:ABC-type Mn2+/Zn2+ transport system ATPase subunit
VRDIYDEVVLLRRRMIAFGAVADVFTEEKLEETFGSIAADGKEVA